MKQLNDNTSTRPRITWKVLPMAQVAILKKYSNRNLKKNLNCELFYSTD